MARSNNPLNTLVQLMLAGGVAVVALYKLLEALAEAQRQADAAGAPSGTANSARTNEIVDQVEEKADLKIQAVVGAAIIRRFGWARDHARQVMYEPERVPADRKRLEDELNKVSLIFKRAANTAQIELLIEVVWMDGNTIYTNLFWEPEDVPTDILRRLEQGEEPVYLRWSLPSTSA
jgi:hypothetical protein